jgi:SAM-dependent methyltransferase
MNVQLHRSDPRILGRRTLQRDHRALAELLRPGLSVLDVGCGTGAITADVARKVAPGGSVVGVDRDPALLEIARTAHGGISNLAFEDGDATALRFRSQFDIVTAARTLQWVPDPALAVSNMKQAARSGGTVLILDYNHSDGEWDPAPPLEFKLFYAAFLAWREKNGWDNRIADRVPELLRSQGLTGVTISVQDERAERGSEDFLERAGIWSGVMDSVGQQIVSAGFCSGIELGKARECYQQWVETELVTQTLRLRAVAGIVP